MGNLIDLTGKKFGRLTVLERDFSKERVYWICKCQCGNLKSIRSDSLKNGAIQSCGCLWKERIRENNNIDLINQQFGKLLVKEKIIINNKTKWRCLCNCGKEVFVSTGNLTSGHTKSCGCLQKEIVHNNNFIDLTGQTFGKLKVLELTGKKNNRTMWRCQCECGNIIETRGTDLRYRKNRSCGCVESKGEQIITNLLIQNNVSFVTQKRFATCRNPETNAQLIFDFYINDSFLLEYDGVQHYQTSSGWNNEQHLNYTKLHDNIKNQWCCENNIPLKRIPYWELDSITIENIMDNTFLIT